MKINKLSAYIFILHIIFLLIIMPCSSNADSTVSELIDVAYVNGSFIAVGEDATILTSPDGATWTKRRSGITKPLYGVTYSSGVFVAVGYGGTILTSPDGVTWTLRTQEIIEVLYGVTYSNGVFVAVGVGGTILTSPDGVTWTPRTSGTTNTFTGVTYGNGVFVAVGDGGTILTSPDGVTWMPRTSGTTNLLYGVTYGNGVFVAVGYACTILTSPDGGTWTGKTSGTANPYPYTGVTYGNGTFAAVGFSYAFYPWAPGWVGSIITSPDGVTWTGKTAGGVSPLYGVAYVNGIFIAVGVGGTIYTSSDGITWTQRKSITNDVLYGVTYGNGTFVFVGEGGTIQSATLDFADFKGTIGTQFTISGSGFGTKKPALYYQQTDGSLKSAGVKIISYSDTSITCIWNKKLPAGNYNLFVKPKIKGAYFIPVSAFSIMNPIIDEVDPRSGSYKDIITTKGQFFSIKKPNVYLEDPDTLKRIKCKVINFTMDSITGMSSLQFIVPKQGYAGHTVVVQNTIGEDAVDSQ
jgi:hypothetical protein